MKDWPNALGLLKLGNSSCFYLHRRGASGGCVHSRDIKQMNRATKYLMWGSILVFWGTWGVMIVAIARRVMR